MAATISGVVKSWNGAKGYGFITSSEVQGDIMFSRTELPADAREVQGKFLQGRAVTFAAQEGPDGRTKATSVHILAVEGQPLAGMVKSFSERHGYGFLTSSSISEDVRFQRADLPPGAATSALVGMRMLFGVQTRPDGKLLATNLRFQSAQEKAKGCGKGLVTALFGGVPMGVGHLPAALGFGGSGPVVALGASGPILPGGLSIEDGAEAAGGEASGVVKSFSERNGYGFINIPGQPLDIKFGKEDLQNCEVVQAGDNVHFAVAVSPQGRLQAKQVLLLQPLQDLPVQRPVPRPTSAARLQAQAQAQAVKRPMQPQAPAQRPKAVKQREVDFSALHAPLLPGAVQFIIAPPDSDAGGAILPRRPPPTAPRPLTPSSSWAAKARR